MQEILKMTVWQHRDKVAEEHELVVDTTVKEANLTHPKDVKLRFRILERILKMGEEVGVRWDRSYRLAIPILLRVIRTRSNNMVDRGAR